MNILETLKNSINSLYVKYLTDKGIVEEPIFYIAGAQTLPPPLPEEEERYYIQKLSEKDNLQARQILVERNLRLVVYIAKKFENTGIGIEDLISIGTIGLAKGVNTFKPDKNIKLATYASRCIENEILMYLRRNNKLKGEISLDEPLNKDSDGNELLLSDILGTEGDVTSRNIEDEVDKKLLKASISNLNEREKNIMEMRFGFKTSSGFILFIILKYPIIPIKIITINITANINPFLFFIFYIIPFFNFLSCFAHNFFFHFFYNFLF